MAILNALCAYKKVGALSLHCDVTMPKHPDEAVPVVVYIHGGALISGNRHGYIDFEKNLLLKNGYAFVSIDYRLAPETKLPEIAEDIRDALCWVRGEGARLFGFDPDKVISMGHSAGGYLALLSGTLDCKPNAILSFYGYGDILGDWYCKPDPFYCSQTLVSEAEAMAGIRKTSRVWGNRFPYYLWTRQNGTWTTRVSGMDCLERREEIAKYCPEFNIGQDYPPAFLLHGDSDTDVPHQQSAQMFEALRAKGITAKLYTEPGGGHGFDGAWNVQPEKFQMVLDFLIALRLR